MHHQNDQKLLKNNYLLMLIRQPRGTYQEVPQGQPAESMTCVFKGLLNRKLFSGIVEKGGVDNNTSAVFIDDNFTFAANFNLGLRR